MSSDLNIYVCTMVVPYIYMVHHCLFMVYTMSEHGISLFGQLETFKVQFSLQTRVSPLGTRLYPIMIAIYSAYRQESANLYIHCLE
jgi:hypothetical protein